MLEVLGRSGNYLVNHYYIGISVRVRSNVSSQELFLHVSSHTGCLSTMTPLA